MPNLILTTCGTSVLTNQVPADRRALLSQHANAPTLDAAATQALAPWFEQRRRELAAADIKTARRLSAELNGLMAFYGGVPGSGDLRQDMHYLLSSDTAIGRTSRDVACDWLRRAGFVNVQPLDVPGLQTGSLANFRVGLSDLMEQLERLVETNRAAGYHVAFNLTGGFKSVNALIQTLGALWADEAFFLFEGSSEVIRIPRLPVALDLDATFRAHMPAIRRIVTLPSVPSHEAGTLPDGLWLDVDGGVMLSPWVEAAWHSAEKRLYADGLLPSWSDRVVFGPDFAASIHGEPPNRLAQVNKRVDDLIRYLETDQPLKRLDFKPVKGGAARGSTHECDAWADGKAKRLYLHASGDGTWILDRLAEALH